MSRPDPKDIFAPKPGIFSWLRDQAYDFVFYEIGAGLDFVGDMFRGPSGYSQSLHRQAAKAQMQTPLAKPLTKSEQTIFAGMLKRNPAEDQVAYWKRKKALLAHPDKQGLVQQHRAHSVETAKGQSRTPQIIVAAPAMSQTATRSSATKQSKARKRR